MRHTYLRVLSLQSIFFFLTAIKFVTKVKTSEKSLLFTCNELLVVEETKTINYAVRCEQTEVSIGEISTGNSLTFHILSIMLKKAALSGLLTHNEHNKNNFELNKLAFYYNLF